MLSRLKALLSDSVVYGLASVITRFISIFLVPIYTRLFTPSDYGVLSLVASSLAAVSIFVGLGLDNSAHRWYWDTADEMDRRRTIASWAWCQLATATLFGLLVYANARFLATRIVGDDSAGVYFKIAAATIPLTVLGTVVNNWFRMQRRPWGTTAYAVGTNLAIVALTLLLVVGMRRGLVGVYMAQAIGLGIGTVVAAGILRAWIAPRFIDLGRLREMLRYALPLIPAALAYWVTAFADRYFVQAYTDTIQVGLYSVGSSIATGAALVTGAFQQAWGPFALSIHNESDARRTYATVFLYYLWIGGLLSAMLALFAPEILRVLATKQYAGASSVVGVLAMSYVMIGLTYIAATGPAIVKQTGPTGIAMTAAALLNVLLNIALVPRFGKVGSAVATLIAQSLTPIYLFYRSQQLYHIPYRFGAGIGIVLATIAIIALGAQITPQQVILAIILKCGLLLTLVGLFFALRLATIGQVVAVISRTSTRARRAAA